MDLSIGRVVARRYRIRRAVEDVPGWVVVDDLAVRRERLLTTVSVDPRRATLARAQAALVAVGECEDDAIAPPLDVGIEDDTLWVVSPLPGAERLDQAVGRAGTLPEDVVLHVLDELARTLDRIHARGLIHGRLRPSSVAFDRVAGETSRVMVLGFVLGELDVEPASPYAAPEQLEGLSSAGPAVDVWALGHIAFFALTGEPFFDHEDHEALHRAVLVHPIPEASAKAAARGASLRAELDPWFARCFARAPSERFASAGEAVTALRETLRVAEASRTSILERRRRFVAATLRLYPEPDSPARWEPPPEASERGAGAPLPCLMVARFEPEGDRAGREPFDERRDGRTPPAGAPRRGLLVALGVTVAAALAWAAWLALGHPR